MPPRNAPPEYSPRRPGGARSPEAKERSESGKEAAQGASFGADVNKFSVLRDDPEVAKKSRELQNVLVDKMHAAWEEKALPHVQEFADKMESRAEDIRERMNEAGFSPQDAAALDEILTTLTEKAVTADGHLPIPFETFRDTTRQSQVLLALRRSIVGSPRSDQQRQQFQIVEELLQAQRDYYGAMNVPQAYRDAVHGGSSAIPGTAADQFGRVGRAAGVFLLGGIAFLSVLPNIFGDGETNYSMPLMYGLAAGWAAFGRRWGRSGVETAFQESVYFGSPEYAVIANRYGINADWQPFFETVIEEKPEALKTFLAKNRRNEVLTPDEKTELLDTLAPEDGPIRGQVEKLVANKQDFLALISHLPKSKEGKEFVKNFLETKTTPADLPAVAQRAGAAADALAVTPPSS